jgi:hypothetical protein
VAAKRQSKWYWRTDYLGYALACAVAWAVIWVLLATLASGEIAHTMGSVFLGWLIWWIVKPGEKRASAATTKSYANPHSCAFPQQDETLKTLRHTCHAGGRGFESRRSAEPSI